MRLALFFACLIAIAGTGALAQQVPAAATRSPATEPPAPPVPPPPARLSNDELLALLRAQTAAIKALSLKLDAIEIRLGAVETKRR